MGDGDKYGDYIGKGIDQEDDARSVDFGDGIVHKVRHSEDNPQKPLDSGRNRGREGNLLASGEQDQQSDKDGASEVAAMWSNKTGEKKEKMKLAMLGAVNGGLSASRKVNQMRGRGVKIALPVATVAIIVGSIMGGIIGGESSLMGSFAGNIQYKLGRLEESLEVRTKVALNNILFGKNTKGGLWSKMTDKMKQQFKKAGIDVETKADGTEQLKYTDALGETKTVTDVEAETKTSPDFDGKYINGTATYATGSAAAYNSDSEITFKSMNVKSRNTNADIEQSDDPEKMKQNVDNDVKQELEEATPRMGADVEGGHTETKEEEVEGGGTRTSEEVETGRNSIDIDSDTNAAARVEEMVKSEVGQGVDFSIVGQAANGMCQLYNTASTINRMVKAYEAAQVVVMGMKIMEAIQRMQAGDGGADTIVNVFANYMTHEVTSKLKIGGGGEDDDVTITTSAIGSAPVAAFFGGSRLSGEDPIVKSFITSENQFRRIMDSISPSAGYKACTATRVAAGLIDTIGDAATLGTKKLLDYVGGVVLSVSISVVVEAVISFMVPKIVGALQRDFTEFLEGAPGGGVISWSMDMIFAKFNQRAGMSVATPSTLGVYAQKRAESIAHKARYERRTHSPFDASSRYTFMGTLTQKLAKASLRTNSIIGKASRISSIVTDSLVALTPASSAASVDDILISEGEHPEINSLVDDGEKRYASAWGTPIYVPDYTTMGEGVEDVMWYWDAKGAFEEPYDPIDNPNPDIEMNGTNVASAKNPIVLAMKEGKIPDIMLAEYDGGPIDNAISLAKTSDQNELSLCIEEKINRGADLGVPDAAIEAKYRPAETGNSFIDAILGAIPIIGGIIDTINGLDVLGHLANILGFKYHTNTKQNHMCERYAGDQQLGEMMGYYDKSKTAVYTEKYYKEHPLDNSPTGVIARFSGLTKEQVEKSIAQVNALMFVADYHPDGLGPLEKQEKPEVTIESTENYIYIIGVVNNINYVESKRSQNITA